MTLVKAGITFADNSVAPYRVGDTTTSGEVARDPRPVIVVNGADSTSAQPATDDCKPATDDCKPCDFSAVRDLSAENPAAAGATVV